MNRNALKSMVLVVVLLVAVRSALCQTMNGKIGQSAQWNSGWIDLAQVTTFQRGDQLQLTIGGTAKKVVVRILSQGMEADQPVGIVGVYDVPADRTIRATLDADYPDVKQISVHGGPNPWDLYDLGSANGPAKLLVVRRNPAGQGRATPVRRPTTSTAYDVVRGQLGAAPQWGSGWIDLARVMTFRKGDQLRLTIGGTAKKVVVRILSQGENAEQPVGVVDVYDIPADRIVQVTLDAEYPDVKQISVHGGPNPWSTYPLGANNGPARLLEVARRPEAPKREIPVKRQPIPSSRESVRGQLGAAPQWGSGWINLAQATTFRKGDQLRLTIGGTAKKVVARILSQGENAEEPVGVVGVYDVPADRIIQVALDAEYPDVKQISVHGGPNPWGMYPLGANNGPANLTEVVKQR